MATYHNYNLIEKIRAKVPLIILISIVFGVLTFTFSNFLTPEYRTSADLLVIQKQSASNVDAFGAAKSAEYLSTILEKGIYSSTFYEDIMDDVDGISKHDFGKNETDIESTWRKQIDAKSVGNTGIVSINVYYSDRDISIDIAEAISSKLINDGTEFHGGGEQVEIKIINGPITSPKPVRPNVWINSFLGFMIGALIPILIILLNASREMANEVERNQTLRTEAQNQIFYQEPANFA